MDDLLLCPKCKGRVQKGFAYCPHCGTKVMPSALICYRRDDRDYMHACVYGPPFHVVHHCKKCRSDFVEAGLGVPEARYCPFCGEEYKENKDGK